MDKNEAVVRVLNNKKGDDDFTGARKVVVIPKVLVSFHSISSFPQSRHQISIFAYLENQYSKISIDLGLGM